MKKRMNKVVMEKKFIVVTISRKDLRLVRDDLVMDLSDSEIESLTDEQMEQIAKRMARLYRGDAYWLHYALATKEITKCKIVRTVF